MNRQGQRSELQERIVQDLQAKAKNAGGAGGDDASKPKNDPPSIDDLKYLEGTKQTTTLAWAWLLIVLFAAVIILMLIIQ